MSMNYKGNPVSRGIAIGEAYLYEAFVPTVEESFIPADQTYEAIARYEAAKEKAKAERETVRARLRGDAEKAKIFSAHIEILFDEAMEADIRDGIAKKHLAPDWAIHQVYEKYMKILGAAKDDLIRERVADMKDVKNRLLRCWQGVEEKNLSNLEQPAVVVARDLLPSDTATLDRSKVLAIVTEIGGATSHSAIIARSYEIPALLGVAQITKKLSNGQPVIVDALDGVLIADPTDAQKAEYDKKKDAYAVKAAEIKKYLDAKPVSPDGTRVEVELNIGSASAKELEGSRYTDGVGLFRTEFLYMGRPSLPSEEEQYEIYKKVLVEFGDRPVILRTLDIGGDKVLESMELPKEENPFLGKRALRLCFDNLPVFKTQLRALLRAAVHGSLWLMLPMVGSMDDIRRAKEIIGEVRADLDKEGVPYGKDYKLGIMVEIPSIALIADLAVQEVDFCSIGTNDLTQYSTAVDRMNPAVSKYYQTFHPALFRLIGFVVDEFVKAGKPVGVCGEMGGDPLAAAVLLGLGMRRLSMGIASVAQIKKLINGLDMGHAEEIAQTVKNLSTAGEVEVYLRKALADIL